MGPSIDGRPLDRLAAPDGCQTAFGSGGQFVAALVERGDAVGDRVYNQRRRGRRPRLQSALDMEVRESEKQDCRKSLK